ncbi:MAG: type IX secretion system protein PorQ [Bacteroidales bacterium]
MRQIVIALILSFSVNGIHSQTGGDNIYEFLNLGPNAYISSLGGFNISTFGQDPTLAMINPALSGEMSHGRLALNYVNYFAGINYGSALYSHYSDSLGSFTAGINYLNYGKFDRADEEGNINGSFTASEYAFNIIYARQIDSSFSFGINLKPILSQLENHISLGLALDAGASYRSPDGLLSAGLVIRNMGFQLKKYTGNNEKLPFEIMAGISSRLRHAPFRFSLTARHLEKYDLIHEYTGQKENTGYTGIEEIAENIMRHLIFGAELIPGENFFISAGFNYQRRKELLHEARASTVGFSIGAGIMTSSVDISLSRARYHLAGSSTNFSLLIKPALFKSFR